MVFIQVVLDLRQLRLLRETLMKGILPHFTNGISHSNKWPKGQTGSKTDSFSKETINFSLSSPVCGFDKNFIRIALLLAFFPLPSQTLFPLMSFLENLNSVLLLILISAPERLFNQDRLQI